MRWNCPHCEELVTAGIDFESTKKAYVRCARCGGMALIHRSAVLADYVKARRMEEEAQLEIEIRLQQELKQRQALQLALAAAERAAFEAASEANAARREAETLAARAAAEIPAPASAISATERGSSPLETDLDGQMLATAVVTETSSGAAFDLRAVVATPPAQLLEANIDGMLLSAASATHSTVHATIRREEAPPRSPPPFAPPFISPTRESTVEAPRAMPVPPAFLMGDVEEAIRAFATDDAPEAPAPRAPKKPPTLAASLAVWAAAALALASGVYLYREGREAFAPSEPKTTAARTANAP